MGIIIALIGLAFLGAGAMIIYKPDSALGTVKLYADEMGLQVMKSVGGILLGVALMVFAGHSNLPTIMMILGVISLVAGVVFFVMKPEQFSNLIRTMVGNYADYAQIAGGVAAVVGLIILYAAW